MVLVIKMSANMQSRPLLYRVKMRFKDTVQLESAVGVDVIQHKRFNLNPCCFYYESLVPFPVYRCLIGRLEIGQWVPFTLFAGVCVRKQACDLKSVSIKRNSMQSRLWRMIDRLHPTRSLYLETGQPAETGHCADKSNRDHSPS